MTGSAVAPAVTTCWTGASSSSSSRRTKPAPSDSSSFLSSSVLVLDDDVLELGLDHVGRLGRGGVLVAVGVGRRLAVPLAAVLAAVFAVVLAAAFLAAGAASPAAAAAAFFVVVALAGAALRLVAVLVAAALVAVLAAGLSARPSRTRPWEPQPSRLAVLAAGGGRLGGSLLGRRRGRLLAGAGRSHGARGGRGVEGHVDALLVQRPQHGLHPLGCDLGPLQGVTQLPLSTEPLVRPCLSSFCSAGWENSWGRDGAGLAAFLDTGDTDYLSSRTRGTAHVITAMLEGMSVTTTAGVEVLRRPARAGP